MKRTLALIGVLALAGTASADDLQDGIALYKQGRYAESEAKLRAASGTEASAYLAAALAKQKRWGDAEGPANAALGADGGHPVAAEALGAALVGQGKWDDAVARMSGVLGKRSDVAYAYYYRGQAYHKKKEIARMVEDYQTFLRLAPNAPEAPQVKVLLGSLK
jgi:tetratricopeptide (TPR) repeat protein